MNLLAVYCEISYIRFDHPRHRYASDVRIEFGKNSKQNRQPLNNVFNGIETLKTNYEHNEVLFHVAKRLNFFNRCCCNRNHSS